MKSWATPNNKQITLYIDQKTSGIKIQFASGGVLPEELKGIYTRESEAEKAVLIYLSKVKQTKDG